MWRFFGGAGGGGGGVRGGGGGWVGWGGGWVFNLVPGPGDFGGQHLGWDSCPATTCEVVPNPQTRGESRRVARG